MLIPVLLVVDTIIWGTLYRIIQQDRAFRPIKPAQTRENRPNRPEQELDPSDLLIKRDFESWLAKQNRPSGEKTLSDYLWEEGIINPDEVVWANGTPLVPGDPDDMAKFEEIKDKAILEGLWEDIPMEDGGQRKMYIVWLRLKGTSIDGANRLLDEGVKPWEFDFDL
jgi:hypothetical protein